MRAASSTLVSHLVRRQGRVGRSGPPLLQCLLMIPFLHSPHSRRLHVGVPSYATQPLPFDPYAFDPYAPRTPSTSPSSSTSSPPTSSKPTPSSQSTSSTTSDPTADPADALRLQILDEALQRVPVHGWSEEAVRAAISHLQLSPSLLSLFPSPLSSLISHFHSIATDTSLSRLSQIPPHTLSTSELLQRGLTLHLQQHLPYLAHLPQLIGLSLTHDRVGSTLSDVVEYVDRLWYAIGDESVDMGWYGKRAVISGVYVASALHLCTDRSAGQRDTWAFLERRLREAEKVQQAPDDIARALQQYGGAALNMAFSLVQPPSNK